MKRIVAGVCSVVFQVGLSAPAHAATNSAPADEYFGRYHLSVLGIRNAVHDMTCNAQDHPEKAADYLSSSQLVDDSIHDWQRRYPDDAWLPKSIYQLERLYVTIGTPDGAEKAVRTADWLGTSFPNSIYARMARVELANLSEGSAGSTADAQPADYGMVPALAPVDTADVVPPQDGGHVTFTSEAAGPAR